MILSRRASKPLGPPVILPDPGNHPVYGLCFHPKTVHARINRAAAARHGPLNAILEPAEIRGELLSCRQHRQ